MRLKLRIISFPSIHPVMKSLTDMAKTGGDGYLPHIIVGDFNQQPDSPGYRIMENGHLPEDARDELQRCRFIGGDGSAVPTGREKDADEEDAAPMENGVDGTKKPTKEGLFQFLGEEFFRHSSPGMKSAYFAALNGREPGVTCIDLEHESPKQTLDYIWFSDASLRLKSVVDVPTMAQIDAQVAFPSQTFPSDHLSLCATFAF